MRLSSPTWCFLSPTLITMLWRRTGSACLRSLQSVPGTQTAPPPPWTQVQCCPLCVCISSRQYWRTRLPSPQHTHTHTVSGPFSIDGNQLNLRQVVDREAVMSYDVTITVQNSNPICSSPGVCSTPPHCVSCSSPHPLPPSPPGAHDLTPEGLLASQVLTHTQGDVNT